MTPPYRRPLALDEVEIDYDVHSDCEIVKIAETPKTYTIANRSDTDRVVMLEHPHRTDFKLTSADKPWETACRSGAGGPGGAIGMGTGSNSR